MQETQTSPLIYTPKIQNVQPSHPSQYSLVKDVTGKPPINREAFFLKDKNGIKIKLPHPPKDNCKKCFGRGYTGINIKNNKLIICAKCYSV